MFLAVRFGDGTRHQQVSLVLLSNLKQCRACGRCLPRETGFHRSPSTFDGFTTLCRDCRKTEDHDYHQGLRRPRYDGLRGRCLTGDQQALIERTYARIRGSVRSRHENLMRYVASVLDWDEVEDCIDFGIVRKAIHEPYRNDDWFVMVATVKVCDELRNRIAMEKKRVRNRVRHISLDDLLAMESGFAAEDPT